MPLPIESRFLLFHVTHPASFSDFPIACRANALARRLHSLGGAGRLRSPGACASSSQS
jgi:hypothetical protein